MLYKYVGNEDPKKVVDYLQRFVNNGTIKATAPQEFNDPAELKANFSFEATKSEIRARINLIWPHINEEGVNFWIDNNDKIAKSNDALNLRHSLIQTSGVICLTLDPDNYLMWSHYAHSHSGFCIGFSDQVLNQFISKDIVAHAFVRYEERPPSVNFYTASIEDVSRAVFMHKSKVWEYEKEFRLIFRSAGIKKISTSSIKEIVLGCRASEELKAYARTLIGSSIRVFKMRESVSSYKLEKIELSENVDI